MKGKHYVVGLLVVMAVGLVGGLTYFYQQAKEPVILQDINDIVYTETVIESQPFYAKFGGVIQPNSLENGKIYVKNAAGEKIEGAIQIIQKRLLAVSDLPAGDYRLMVEADVLEEAMKHSQSLTFTVYEEQEHVASAEELQRYFTAGQQSREAQNLNDVMTNQLTLFVNFSEEESSADTSGAMENNVASKSESADYSDTNNQVAGIEEGDIVVTDGDYVYTARDDKIYIIETKPLQAVEPIQLKDMYVSRLMKQGDYLLVFYDSYEQRKGQHVTLTKVNIYDVKNPKQPKLVRELGQEGYMVGARLMDNTLYMTTEKYDIPEANGKSDLRPALYDSERDKDYVDYEDIAIFPGVQGESYTVISAITLEDVANSELKTSAFIGSGGQFYMSEQAIYLAAQHYEVMPMELIESSTATTDISIDRGWWQPATTTIYKYKVDGTVIERVAEAKVDGSVLNQFSMDEHEGFFRIATTSGSASLRNADSNNHLTVLNDKLQEVGKLTDLARGERIYSVRYMGDKAYIVTFKETDPLFVIDVADPKNPHVLGELKIPGFSNYLHPLNESHLIGIGYETEVAAKDGVVLTQGMKVSLFDVSDVNNPAEVDVEIIGGRGTYSDVQYDHKALYRDVKNHYYGFPITIYEDNVYKGAGASMLEITEQGIESVGDFIQKAQGEQYEDWEDTVRRLVYSGETLYIVYNGKIVTYDRQTLKKIAEVSF